MPEKTKPWFWAWISGGPQDYMPADSAEDAAAKFAKNHECPWNSRIYVSVETRVFDFSMKEAEK